MSAWKDLERRLCRSMGGQRRPQIGPDGRWAQGSDDDGSLWCTIEAKYLKHYQLRSVWLKQARAQGRKARKPWVIGMAEHRTHTPIAICDWDTLVELAYEAGRIDTRRWRLEQACDPDSPIDIDEHVSDVMATLEEKGL